MKVLAFTFSLLLGLIAPIFSQSTECDGQSIFIELSPGIGNQTIYLKDMGLSIIDSVSIHSTGYFCLPQTAFPLFSIAVKDYPEVSKVFMLDDDSKPVRLRIDSLAKHRIYLDAGLCNDVFETSIAELQNCQSNYYKTLEEAPRYPHERKDLHDAHLKALMDIFNYYFDYDEVVGIALLWLHRNRLELFKLPYRFLEQLGTRIRKLNDGLKNHPAVLEISQYLDPFLYAMVGFPALNLVTTSNASDTITTDEFLGQFLVLCFSAADGTMDRWRTKELLSIYQDLVEKDIVVFSVNLRPDLAEDIPWRSGYIKDEEQFSNMKKFYQLDHQPKIVLVSPLGKITATDIGKPADLFQLTDDFWRQTNDGPFVH
jgi:hypothetical protein